MRDAVAGYLKDIASRQFYVDILRSAQPDEWQAGDDAPVRRNWAADNHAVDDRVIAHEDVGDRVVPVRTFRPGSHVHQC